MNIQRAVGGGKARKKNVCFVGKSAGLPRRSSSNSRWTICSICSLVIYSSGRVELQEESASSAAVAGRGDTKENTVLSCYCRAIVK